MRSKRVLEYNVFQGNDAVELADGVTKLVNEGWSLVGGPFVNDGVFHQAVIREKTAEQVALESGAVKKQNDGSLEFGVDGDDQ